MRLRTTAIALLLPVALLAGCGSGDGTNAQTAITTPTGTELPNAAGTGTDGSAQSSVAPTMGPEVPGATAVAQPVAKDQLPTASGKFGEKPALTFPKNPPPPSLQRQVLSEGTGKETKSGDHLVTNYLGQIWNGKVFDNSYDRKATTTFQIGVGKVVSGWDVGLVGVKVGSRVLLSLPPADGYKSTGNEGAGIKGTDTIVFVVDIVDAISSDQGGQADAKPVELPAGQPKVTGVLGKEPKLTVPAGTPQPKEAAVYPISTGTGEKVKEGDQLLAQYLAVRWDNQPVGSTWPGTDPNATGLTEAPVAKGGPFEKLAGMTIGSRVLLVLPPSAGQDGTQQPAIAVVVDIVGKS